jgi:hypothetical protein
MSIAAPPRPPRPSDPVERDDPEALIEEARQRTRRRRRRHAAAAVLVAIIGVSLFIVFGRSGPSLSVASGTPAFAGAADKDDAATVIVHDFQMHWGWVLAYADGRVIWQFDRHGPARRPFERHLTPKGVDLVRSGAIPPHTLLFQATDLTCPEGEEVCPSAASAVPAGTWADSEIRVYEPSRWSIGALSEYDIGRFPAAAQAVLRGAKRATYNNITLLYPDIPTSPTESIELTTAELGVLRVALIDEGIPLMSLDSVSDPNAPVSGPFVSPTMIRLGNGLQLFPSPILPHGEPVAFGG